MSRTRTPPNFRLAKSDPSGESCDTCIYFYLTKGWIGLGECTQWDHITDESLLCDSQLSQTEAEGEGEEDAIGDIP